MTLKKIGIGVASLALALSPALAQASPTGHGKPEGTPGKGKGATQRSESGSQHAGGSENHGKGQANPGKCSTHEVAYIASGVLVSDTLTKSEHGATYNGQVTVEVAHTNQHAHAAHGETETYTLQNARVRGPIAVTALKQGDRVKLIGKITAMSPKCESSTFTPTIAISKLVFHKA